MSVVQIGRVFEHSASKGSARLVLIALADVAADDGQVTAYARSHGILARKANVDTGTVRKAIRALVKLGEVEVLDVGDGRASSNYRLHLPAPSIEGGPGEGGPDAPPPDPPPGGANGTPSPGQMHPQGAPDAPPIIPSCPSPPVSDRLDLTVEDARPVPGFAEFWDACRRDRRPGKADAERAWAAAVKLAPPEVIVAGMLRYVEETADREARHVKTPGPWLRERRWTDEPGANRGRRTRTVIVDREAPSGVVAREDL